MQNPGNISKENFIILPQPTNNLVIRTNLAKYKLYVYLILHCAASLNIFEELQLF